MLGGGADGLGLVFQHNTRTAQVRGKKKAHVLDRFPQSREEMKKGLLEARRVMCAVPKTLGCRRGKKGDVLVACRGQLFTGICPLLSSESN